jgi:hypothetical protein
MWHYLTKREVDLFNFDFNIYIALLNLIDYTANARTKKPDVILKVVKTGFEGNKNNTFAPVFRKSIKK